MLVQDPLSKYPRLGKYALIFSIIPGYFHEYDAEEVIQQAVNSQSVHGFLKLLQDKNVAIAFPSYYKGKYAIKPEVRFKTFTLIFFCSFLLLSLEATLI